MTLNGTNGHQNGYHAGELAATLIDVQPTAAQAAAYLKVQQAQAELDAALKPDAPTEVQGVVWKTIADILNTPPTKWQIPGILPMGGVSLLSGQPKSGKTYLMLAMLKAVSDGGNFLNLAIPPMHSWLWSEQSPQSLLPQVEKFGLSRDADIKLAMADDQPRYGSSQEFADAIYTEYVNAHQRPGLVVIDTLGSFVPMEDSNDYGAVLRLMQPIVQSAHAMSQLGDTAFLLVHHGRKAGGHAIESVLGSGAFSGQVDMVLSLTKPGKGPTRKLNISGRFGTEILGDEVGLELDKATSEYKRVNPDADHETAILNAIEAGFGKRSDILGAIEGMGDNTGTTPGIFNRVIRQMVEEGGVIRTGEKSATRYSVPD